MSVLEVGIAIPDTYEELMTIWGEDGPNATLIVWTKTKGFFRKKKEEVQRKEVRLPMKIGEQREVNGIWHVDRFCVEVGFVIEQPDGPWDMMEDIFRPTTTMKPGDALVWTAKFEVVW